jgi:serine/threonine protein kinase
VGCQINGFEIERKVGSGGFGTIYAVRDMRLNERFAMKVEDRYSNRTGIVVERSFLDRVQSNLTYFPEMICSGITPRIRYLVMELLGPSLSKMRRIVPGRRYSASTAMRLAYHSFCCIEAFHQLELLHRDLKPGNFVLRAGRAHPVCLIDFGLARSYRRRDGRHIEFREDAGFVGTCRYASLHAHCRLELSRRDDLISWFYTVVELVEGKMPWPGKQNKERCIELKQTTSTEMLCKALPAEFIGIFEMINDLEFEETPRYDMIKQILLKVINQLGGLDIPFDWEELSPEALKNVSAIDLLHPVVRQPRQQPTHAGTPGGKKDGGAAAGTPAHEAEGGCARCHVI